MISDTLSDAAAEIREYLRDMPEVYAAVLPDIVLLLEAMDSLRIRLDAPPDAAAGGIEIAEVFKRGDAVDKIGGDYQVPGEVRGAFTLYDGGPIRYIVAHRAEGGGLFGHIYSPHQLRPRP